MKTEDIKPGIAPLVPFIKPRYGTEIDFMDLYNSVIIKTHVYGIYGIGAKILTPDGEGTILTLHGRAVDVGLKVITVGQDLKGRALSTGCGLDRCYLHQDFNCPLLLRPLSSISDEESNICGELHGYIPADGYVKFYEGGIPLSIAFYDGGGYKFVNHATYQYLQQQGFALPIFYNGTQYTVEQLTEMQIIKLTT